MWFQDDEKYIIEIMGKPLGYTFLEKADPPMGVVFGEIIFANNESGYRYFKAYSQQYSVTVNEDDAKNKYIYLSDLVDVRVISEQGVNIAGISITFAGFGDEGHIEIIGIAYPFYKEEFPHHYEAYQGEIT